jgi:ABC-type sugar transport system permease subunit
MTTQEQRPAAPTALTRPSAPRRRHRKGPSLVSQDRRLGTWLVAPAAIVLLAIIAYPLIYNIWNSFHHVDYQNPPVGGFAGFSNYALLFSNPLPNLAFMPALLHTVGFTVVSVVLETVIGIAIAVALSKPFRGRGVVRAAMFIPWAVPTVVSAELWKTMFDPQNGFVNYMLKALNLPGASTDWLTGNQWTAWTGLLVADAWRNTPFMGIVLLAGLQVIPADVYEAARIDGASAWKTFWRITMPLLKPALAVALIFRTLSSFMIFDVVYIMTHGGPIGPGGQETTNVLANLDYAAFITNSNFGYGGAISVSMIIIALMIAAIYVRVFRTQEQTT